MITYYTRFFNALLNGEIDLYQEKPPVARLLRSGYQFDPNHSLDDILRYQDVYVQVQGPPRCAGQLPRKPQVGEYVVFTLGDMPLACYTFLQPVVMGQVYWNWEQINLTHE